MIRLCDLLPPGNQVEEPRLLWFDPAEVVSVEQHGTHTLTLHLRSGPVEVRCHACANGDDPDLAELARRIVEERDRARLLRAMVETSVPEHHDGQPFVLVPSGHKKSDEEWQREYPGIRIVRMWPIPTGQRR